MKIFITYKQTSGAWGGGNQFLKALHGAFMRQGVLASSVGEADAVLFNGYQELKDIIRHWLFRRRGIRVYRLGPVMSLHRNGYRWKIIDWVMVWVAQLIADVVIFQSQWSLEQARRRGFSKKQHVFVISNAVDHTIFHPGPSIVHDRIRLLYVSWSSNENKGFSYLQYLDEHLDTKKYEMVFVGNTPRSFKKITTLPPMESHALAEMMRTADIFISPTKDDACSNAILEALASGVPVVALASGGNPELIQKGGVLFSTPEELLSAIDQVTADLASYKAQVTTASIEEIAKRYQEAMYASITV